MKKPLTILTVSLIGLCLVACAKPNSTNKAKSSSSQPRSSQSSSKSSSSSSSSITVPSSSSETDFFESQEDSDKVLSKLTDAASIPEWEGFKAIQLDDGVTITQTDENGNTVEIDRGQKNPTPYTYQDVVNTLGQPISDVGQMIVWNANVTIMFSGDYASTKSISSLPGAKTIPANAVTSIATGSNPDTVLKQLGQPDSVIVSTRSTALMWKDDQGQQNSVFFSDGLVQSTMSGADAARMAESLPGLSSSPTP